MFAQTLLYELSAILMFIESEIVYIKSAFYFDEKASGIFKLHRIQQLFCCKMYLFQ